MIIHIRYYEILSWGTALWKLLDCVCSGPINTLAFGAWWSAQTTHVANERERKESPWSQSSSLITIYRVIIPVYPFRKRLFLFFFWKDDATTSHHFTAPGSVISQSYQASSPQLYHRSNSQPTLPTWFTGPHNSQPGNSSAMHITFIFSSFKIKLDNPVQSQSSTTLQVKQAARPFTDAHVACESMGVRI